MAENEELQEMGEGETRQKILVADDEARGFQQNKS